MVSVGSIVSGAFRSLKEQPLAVSVWGLVYLLSTIGSTYALLPYYRMIAAAGSSPAGGLPAGYWSMMGLSMLVQLVLLVLFMILFNASQRAVLRPEESSLAFIRLGMDELRVIGLALFLGIAFYISFFIVVLIVTLIAASLAVLAGPGAVMIGFVVVAGSALIAFFIWLQVRLSLVFPLTLMRRKMIIGESWRLTGGRFWSLFGGYLAIGLVLFVLWIAVLSVTAGPYLVELARGGFSFAALEAAGQRQMAEQLSGITPMMVIGWIVAALFGALSLALTGGAVATAAKGLASDEDALVREFE